MYVFFNLEYLDMPILKTVQLTAIINITEMLSHLCLLFMLRSKVEICKEESNMTLKVKLSRF